MILDRPVVEQMPNRSMLPTMQLLWIDGRLFQAFDEVSGRPGVWALVQSVTMRDAQAYRLVDRPAPDARQDRGGV